MWGSTVAFIIKHYELLQCFQHDFFSFFCSFFPKIISVDLIFLILSWLRILLYNFFSLKHCELLQCFPIWFFYYFFQNYLCPFLFNIKLVKNYNHGKAYGKSIVVFLTKYYGLLQYFSKWFFNWFYFIGESTIVFITKHCQMLQRFSSWVFFLPKISMLFFLILSW